MKHPYLLALVIPLILACGIQSAVLPTTENTMVPATFQPQISKSSPPMSNTPSIPFLTVTGDVYLRDYDNTVRGSLAKGTQVRAWCGLEICYLQDGSGLTVWRGCLSDNPRYLKCETK